MEAPDPLNVRIITTLGHVDHGKTTLMDALLAANNIISPRMAGKMRYLDSREDEQERGITMESSAVSLKFQVMERNNEGERLPKTYIVNMIDTPGHVDFSSEVSTASRLCDGALVLVDAVEGVCTQTISVLRQAWTDRLRPILIINKIDRLITEIKLAPAEAQHHLARLLEQVNAVMGSFFAEERMDDDLRWREEREKRLAEKKEQLADETDANVNDAEEEFQEKDDEDIYFAPERGNVIFASAIDGWGFRVSKFAQLYAAKLGIKEGNLRRVLWGDYFLDPKTKKVISYKYLRGRPLKSLFVQFVLENIWAVYDAVDMNPNPDRIAKIISTLSLKVPPRDLKSKDTKHLLWLVMSQWLSLSTSIIQTAIDIVPAPSIAQKSRIPKILYPDLTYEQQGKIEPKNTLEKHLFLGEGGEDKCVVGFVSKMFAVERRALPENKKRKLTAEEMRAKAKAAREARAARQAQANGDAGTEQQPAGVDLPSNENQPADNEATAKEETEEEILLGFARLYSGTLHINTPIYCVLPKYNPSLPLSHPTNKEFIKKTKVEGLYVMMGRELVGVESVKAGSVFAVKGLEGKVGRSGTICAIGGRSVASQDTTNEEGTDEGQIPEHDQQSLVNLGGVNRQVAPIVRVALEPVNPADLGKLVRGLKLLSQSDPCVEVFQQQTGEWVILTAGELHLERCLKDLRERFAKVEIHQSEPIVPFRETAIRVPEMVPTKSTTGTRGSMVSSSSSGVVQFTIRAVPLPKKILQFILQNVIALRGLLQSEKRGKEGDSAAITNEDNEEEEGTSASQPSATTADTYGDVVRVPSVALEQFWEALRKVCDEAGGEWRGGDGGRDLVERIWAFGPHRAGGCVLIDARKIGRPVSLKRRLEKTKAAEGGDDEKDRIFRDFENHIETGFQLAAFQGPLCAEPVEGLAYFVEIVEVNQEALTKEIEQNRLAQVMGSIISGVRDACRNGLLDWSPRLMLAMYTCDIQASTDVLGKVYAVVAKRRGKIVAEEMKEGTSLFNVTALLPVVESFGFADDIRKRTSGAASPQLVFSGYDLLDLDPFWVPTTEEELEDLGEKADRVNVAKVYMDAVRERKGLFVDRKIVEFAEKQRTLKR